MLIGITGTDGSGKGTVVDYLVKEKGFAHYSARQIWNDEIDARGMDQSRANMRLVANDLRKQHGSDYLVTYYLKKMMEDGVEDAIIDSLRTVAEVETLRENGGILFSVDADQTLRYERITTRASSSDDVSFEEFTRLEEVEMNDPDPNGMQKAKVIAMADYTLTNDKTLDELHAQIEHILEEFSV